MNFKEHWSLKGKHAFLSASKYHWIRYSDEKLMNAFALSLSAEKGARLHAFAAEAIKLGIRQSRSKKTLNMYINDAIGFRMEPEVVLFYSENAFGTADAISFIKNKLRIHDLKTGVTPASMDQLEIYAAFFCLEYEIRPVDISIELRIYQNDDVVIAQPEPEYMTELMSRVIAADRIISAMRLENIS